MEWEKETTDNTNVKIVTTHNGVRITDKFFKDHPELREKYPSKNDVTSSYLALVRKANGKNAILTITENGICEHIA